jgi:hypothetical protein
VEGWVRAPAADWARRLLAAFVLRVVAVFTLLDLRVPGFVDAADIAVGVCVLGLALALRPVYASLPAPLGPMTLAAGLASGAVLVGGDVLAIVTPGAVTLAIADAGLLAGGLWLALTGLAWLASGRRRRTAWLGIVGGSAQLLLGTILAAGGPGVTLFVAVIASVVSTIPFYIALTQRPAAPAVATA